MELKKKRKKREKRRRGATIVDRVGNAWGSA
jgi:hypothetical protein